MAIAKTFEVTYFFRPTDFDAATLEALKAAQSVTLHENGKWKRNPLKVALSMPSELEAITDSVLVALAQDLIKAYCKVSFIDKFLPVGEHDWKTVSTWYEESGRSSGTDDAISDEDAGALAKIFNEYWSAQGKEAVGQLFAELCTKKCGWAAVRKLCTPKGKTITVDIVNKYRDKFSEMATAFAEHKEVAEGFKALSAVLADHAEKKFVQEDAASAW